MAKEIEIANYSEDGFLTNWPINFLNRMLIEIGEDIVNYAKIGDGDAVEALQKLAYASKYGKHVVFASIPMLQQITHDIKKLDEASISIYKKVRDKAYKLQALRQKIKISAIVTFTKPQNQNLLWIDPKSNKDFELYEETHLLSENLLDITFYIYVSKYYQSTNKLSKHLICFYPLQGGGNTIKDVYKREVELKQHFCLAIMDSDKKYPHDQCGQTSKELEQIHNTQNPFNCAYYIMNDVCEIENLLPQCLIAVCDRNNKRKIFQLDPPLDLSYFDMKKGLVPCQIKDENAYEYWLEKLAKFEELKNKLENCRECLENSNYSVSKEKKRL